MILEKNAVQEMVEIVGRNLLESITKKTKYVGKKTRYVRVKRIDKIKGSI